MWFCFVSLRPASSNRLKCSFYGQFAGSKLPHDDGEFYQFCYVTESGRVHGASTPFQFEHAMTDDTSENEDENGGPPVITAETALLEDQLRRLV